MQRTEVARKKLPIAQEMLKVFYEKFDNGRNICIYEEGPRRQQKGFYPYQIFALVLDPKTKSLIGVPENKVHDVWDLVKRICVSDIIKKSHLFNYF